MEYRRNDEILVELLKETKSIYNFLDAVFGFLARRTDFYHTMKSDTDTMGFQAGIKEKLVMSTLKKFETKSAFTPTTTHLPAKSDKIVVDKSLLTSEKTNNNNTNSDIPNCLTKPSVSTSISKSNNTSSEQFHPNEYYNGACFEKYCWSQSINEIEVHINLPQHIKSPKQLAIQIESEHIKVTEKINNVIILEGQIARKCKHNDAVWSCSSGKLSIALDKIHEIWWSQFFKTEPQIDLTKMDCSRNIDELPNETQAAIEKLKWDQQQEMLGLPTSEEIKNHEILKKAWNAEGSPFQGQPFDPSTVKFN